MPKRLNVTELAAALKARRAGRGLREVAAEIGEVSASTLSRIEQGKVPDLDTFARLCQWLEMPADRFLPVPSPTDAPELSTEKLVTAQLRADKTLDAATANALVMMIHQAYQNMAVGRLGKKAK